MKLIVAQSSIPGSITLDPFAGSGAFLTCANGMGRKFIGIDQSEEAAKVIRVNLEGDYTFVDMR